LKYWETEGTSRDIKGHVAAVGMARRFVPILHPFRDGLVCRVVVGKGFSLHLHRFPLDTWLRKEKAEKELGDGSSVL